MSVQIYGLHSCPFSERVRIVAAEKGIPVEFISIEEKKPDWFLEVSPSGTSPILEHNGRRLRESMAVIEYLEEAFPDKVKLWPSDPMDRAWARVHTASCGDFYWGPYMKLLNAVEEPDRAAAKEALLQKLKTLNKTLISLSPQGPFFLGSAYSVVDAVFATWMERVQVIGGHYRAFEVPDVPELHRLNTWWHAVSSRSSFTDVRPQPDELISHMRAKVK
mmetsp:Transcript_10395/g.18179  ORF Transcript_10395/g.18179 Transcript_10395/m.18179 type:complete len:219 (-) Transcript_10395:647-1303(-)|eukprot:CAMPEP_0196657876 /NCGR_PEP_ID=MMETSP1086-20130531/26207_1 /TAXON_ID=77921 /ORGANISM="Cyanoptyche  gloeocystis , Strain SAG4.97" /LENGTH=218 /DNA_ID=CAMNT_0041991189 /DNA_START=57 /DNA_END=713 /DNA_ORIENTATION=+